MIELECPSCSIKLRIPPNEMGQSGKCNHCGHHLQLPPLWKYRAAEAGALLKKYGGPFLLWIVLLPFTLLGHLVRFATGGNGIPHDASPAERLLILEARKQTKIARASRSDTSCCLGCVIILLILMFTGLLGPLLAIVGLGGLVASQ